MNSMKILFRDCLNQKEQEALISLTERANRHGGLHYAPPVDGDLYFLCMETDARGQDFLAAALCVYHMGDCFQGMEVDELSAFTAPACQGRGLFSALFSTAKPLLRPAVRFAVYPSEVSEAVLSHMGASFSHAEHLMELELSALSELPAPAPQELLEQPLSFQREPECRLVRCPFGECRLFPGRNDRDLYLSGMLIYGRFRKQGYGRRFLRTLFSKLWQEGVQTIFLEVSSENLPAMKLYQGLGFHTLDSLSYYYLLPEKTIGL